jgi:hypothetical protein
MRTSEEETNISIKNGGAACQVERAKTRAIMHLELEMPAGGASKANCATHAPASPFGNSLPAGLNIQIFYDIITFKDYDIFTMLSAAPKHDLLAIVNAAH